MSSNCSSLSTFLLLINNFTLTRTYSSSCRGVDMLWSPSPPSPPYPCIGIRIFSGTRSILYIHVTFISKSLLLTCTWSNGLSLKSRQTRLSTPLLPICCSLPAYGEILSLVYCFFYILNPPTKLYISNLPILLVFLMSFMHF